MFECFRSGDGEFLARPEYFEAYDRIFHSGIRRFDKLERHQTFAERGSASWDAFMAGDWDGALRLIEARKEKEERAHREMVDRGLVFRRLRVVELPVGPYLQWEMHSFRQRFELGAEIRVLDARQVTCLEEEGHLPEVVILGESVMFGVIYDEELKGAGARQFTDPGDVATAIAEFESLYAKGEGFSAFFKREIAPLGPPAVR